MHSIAQVFSVALTVGVSGVLANPIAQPDAYPIALPEPLNMYWKRQGTGQCQNQSCEIAAVAGSTGATVYPYCSYPSGDSQSGDCCIIRYFPAVKAEIYANRPGLQAYCALNGGDAPADSNPPGVTSVSAVSCPSTTTAPKTTSTSLFGGIFARDAEAAPAPAATTTAACKPKILIFAKGTLETGSLGNTLGPQLQSSLDSNTWSVIGVTYDNSLDNDYCLGLPGGVSARTVLAQTIAQCPNSKIAMSGYSQGAMVVRNAIARAPAAQVAKIKSVVNFGDPFDGAAIGQYSGPTHVFCNSGDGVCNGQLDITLAHLSYGGDVSQAVALLNADTA